MGTADARWVGLARRLVEHEAKGNRRPDAVARAAEAACVRLHDRLVPLIGPDGFRIMLANAVDVTRSDYPFLQAIDVRAERNGCFSNLTEAVSGRPDEQALEAVARVIAEFMSLLGSFVGEALTVRLVRGAWPEVSWEGPGANDRETSRG